MGKGISKQTAISMGFMVLAVSSGVLHSTDVNCINDHSIS